MERLPLSVCIIARNEQQRIEQCIASVAPVAAQIVVADTGSTDATIERAIQCGAEVFSVEWKDDFAAARNASLARANQPWILVVDADERLITPGAVAAAIRNVPADVGGLLVAVRSISTAGGAPPTLYATQVLRLFRNNECFRYEGIIHEQILPAVLRAGYRCLPSSIVVEHEGYNLDPQSMQQKHRRNLRLLDQAVERQPESAFYRFHRAKIAMALGMLERAEDDLRVALQHARNDGILLPQVLNHAALLAAVHQRWRQSIAYAQQSLTLLPQQPMSWFLIGESFRALGDYWAALNAYRHTEEALKADDYRVRIVGTLHIPHQELQERIAQMERALQGQAPTSSIPFAHYHYSASEPMKANAKSPDRPLLTLAMIVRNEEEMLPRCLESVRGVVEQIVAVDTGSSDATITVAERYGAEVYRFEWCDDFAAARNEALRHARGEWILYLDADETLTPESASILRNVLQQQPLQVGGLLCTIVSPHRQDSGSVETHRGAYPRLFRNYGYPRIAFRGRVHEQITPAIIECGGGIVHSPIVIYHSGYNIPREHLEAKVRRNYRLLIQHVQEEPLNAYAWFQLGQTLARMRLFAEAEGAFELALQIGLSPPLRASATAAMSYLCGAQGRYAEAIDWAEQSLRVVPDQAIALAYKAHALEALGDIERAHAAFTELLSRLDRQPEQLAVGFEIELDRAAIERKLQALSVATVSTMNA
ncbi:MAG: glycosyltransferase [Chlorobi bacterium]|nr:glycosyltransferase [Chlorobiota bacterium]